MKTDIKQIEKALQAAGIAFDELRQFSAAAGESITIVNVRAPSDKPGKTAKPAPGKQ